MPPCLCCIGELAEECMLYDERQQQGGKARKESNSRVTPKTHSESQASQAMYQNKEVAPPKKLSKLRMQSTGG
eukprot:559229-Pelagomonas_calceolata.AAC.7